MDMPNEYSELLFAYSVGCLDREDLKKLLAYFQAGEDYEWQELGEYQNLVALLPSILEIEEPSPRLKDKVARKLYRFKPEKKSSSENGKNLPGKSSTSEHKKTFTAEKVEPITSGIIHDEENKIEHSLNEEGSETNTDIEEVHSKESNKNQQIESQETQISSREGKLDHLEEDKSEKSLEPEEESSHKSITQTLYEKRVAQDNRHKKYYEPEKKKGGKGWLIFSTILFFIIAAGMVYLFFKVSSEVKGYKAGIENLNKQISSLSTQLNSNQELQDVLQTKNVRIITLNNTKLNPSGFGKLIISLDNSKGFLQLSQMPDLRSKYGYELWVKIKRKYISLGVFTPSKDVNYFPFSLPELTNDKETNFIVTEESVSGAVAPGKKVVLTGSLK